VVPQGELVSYLRKIRRLLNNKSTVDISVLREHLSGRSRRSIFRDLSKIKYLASFTHSGRYFTLPSIAQFDSRGLWFVGEIGFSRHGTLKATIVRIVGEADAGHIHEELEEMFHVRVHNVLLDLVKTGQITRELFGNSNVYLYLSSERGLARRQLQKRLSFCKIDDIAKSTPPLLVVSVLVEVIRDINVRVSASEIWQRLQKQGDTVRLEQVEYVFARYGIGVKKTLDSR